MPLADGWGSPPSHSKEVQRLLPPNNFTPAGVVEWVKHSPTVPPFIHSSRRSRGRRRAGEMYETKVQRWLENEFEGNYLPSPWFYFKAVGSEKVRWCQPDGLLFDFQSGLITIVEVKLQHTAAAWWQVKLLYFPLVVQLFPPNLWRYTFVEIVKWYDKDTLFPERVQLLPHLALAEENRFGVHILKP